MDYILTPEQFAFMQRYHETIEYSMFSYLISGHSLIDAIMTWPEWKSLFGTMGWDDAYDRYEDTPGYDRTFKLMLRAWLEENPQLSRMRVHKRKSSVSNDPADYIDLDDENALIKIRDQQKARKQSDRDEK